MFIRNMRNKVIESWPCFDSSIFYDITYFSVTGKYDIVVNIVSWITLNCAMAIIKIYLNKVTKPLITKLFGYTRDNK